MEKQTIKPMPAPTGTAFDYDLYKSAFLAALTGIAWKQQIASVAAYTSAVVNSSELAMVAERHLRAIRTRSLAPDFGGTL